MKASIPHGSAASKKKEGNGGTNSVPKRASKHNPRQKKGDSVPIEPVDLQSEAVKLLLPPLDTQSNASLVQSSLL